MYPKMMMDVRSAVCKERYKIRHRCEAEMSCKGSPTIYHANGLEGQQQETKPPLLHIYRLPSAG